jgi:hypothetical protein
MNKQISNRITFYFLVLIISVSLYSVYQNTYGIVWGLKTEYEALIELSESGRDYSAEIAVMNNKLKEINALIGADKVTGGDIQYFLLSELQNLSSKLPIKITNVPAPHSFNFGNFSVITGYFEMTGNYVELLKVIDYLETTFPYASLSSVQFRLEEDLMNNKKKLFLLIYLQNISPNEK